MILGFSTQLNGKPTNFVEKIWNSFEKQLAIDNFQNYFEIDKGYKFNDVAVSLPPKIHTIRDDPKDRWKKGNKIDFFINVRKKNMFRFAPVLPVVSIQTVSMSYAYNDIIEISINGRQLHDNKKILEFIQNDGFDTWKDFFDYFYPLIKATKDNWFEAKIIHWTDLRY